MNFRLVLVQIIALVILQATQANAADSATLAHEKLRIAAASDLKFALDEIKNDFAKKQPHIDLDITTGSSGTFTQQIEAGAPFDLFLSADRSFPERLKAKGLVNGEIFRYGSGRLVLWTKSKTVLTRGLQSLRDPIFKKIAVANPAHAPYGRIAKEALEKAGLYRQIENRLVTGDSIAQTAQFAATGAADVGLIALALALSPQLKSEGHYTLVKEAAELEQCGVILNREKKSALAFRDYLLSADGQAHLSHYGLEQK